MQVAIVRSSGRSLSEFRHNIQSSCSFLPEMRRRTFRLLLLPVLVSVLDAGIIRDVIETLEDLSLADMMNMIPTYGLQIPGRGIGSPPLLGHRLRRKESVRHPHKRKGRGRNGNLKHSIRRPERAPVWYVEKTDNLLTETQSREAELRWQEENWKALARQWGARLEQDWHRRNAFKESSNYPDARSTDSLSSSLDALTAELDSLTGWGEDIGLGTQVEPVVKRMRGILRRLAINRELDQINNIIPDDSNKQSDVETRIISATKWEDVSEEAWQDQPVSVSEWGRGAKGVTIFASDHSSSAGETRSTFEVNDSGIDNDFGYSQEALTSSFSDQEASNRYTNAEAEGFADGEATKTNPYKFTMADAILHLPSNYRDPEDNGGQLEKSGDYTFYNPDEDFYDLSALASSGRQTEGFSDENYIGTRRQDSEDTDVIEFESAEPDDNVIAHVDNALKDTDGASAKVDDKASEEEEEKDMIGGDKMLIYRAWLGTD